MSSLLKSSMSLEVPALEVGSLSFECFCKIRYKSQTHCYYAWVTSHGCRYSDTRIEKDVGMFEGIFEERIHSSRVDWRGHLQG